MTDCAPNFHDTRALAADPSTPPEILQRLILDADPAIATSAAENPNTPAEALLEAAMLGGLVDGYTVPYRSLAWNPNSSPELLMHLAGNSDPLVRARVARNPSTAPSTLSELAKDVDRVVASVAGNPRTPADTLEWLSINQSPYAYTPYAEIFFQTLAKHPNASVKCLLSIIERGHGVIVAERRNLPLAVQLSLAEQSSDVRLALARNDTCDQSILTPLAQDEERLVREAVAGNNNCPESTLQILAKEEDVGILTALAGNPRCPDDVLPHA